MYNYECGGKCEGNIKYIVRAEDQPLKWRLLFLLKCIMWELPFCPYLLPGGQ